MHPQVLGGPGHAVEVDEAKFGRRKYNRGRYIESHWVLGGIDRDRKQVFMEVVDRGDAATLIPIIQQYVRPGTLIITDEWRAYRTLHLLSGTSIKLLTTVNTLLIPIQGHYSPQVTVLVNTAFHIIVVPGIIACDRMVAALDYGSFLMGTLRRQ